MDRALVESIAARMAESKGWPAPEFVDAGNSAAVFKVVHPERGDVALKVYDPKFFEGDNALIEAKRVHLQVELRGHGHPNLIEVLDVEHLANDATWALLMEFCPWPSLEKALPAVPDDAVPALIKQLAAAVDFLDSKGLVHRDIKPANIVISPQFDQLKLLDLGVLRRIAPDEGNGTDATEKKRFIATAQYSPPEYLLRQEPEGQDGFRALNIYQIGAVLHDLIMKVPIYNSEAATANRYVLFHAITNSVPRVYSAGVAPRLVALCRSALEKDPLKRIVGVSVSDFGNDADSRSTLRKRVSAARPAPPAATEAPSLLLWQSKIGAWIRKAALSESGSLGPCRLAAIPSKQSARWTLTFPLIERSISAELRRSEDGLSWRFLMSVKDPSPITIDLFEVNGEGCTLSGSELVDAIAGQLLYLVDLASQPADTGGEEALDE